MDLYNILSINKGASEEDIKKAYRKASLKHHPDRGGNAEEFKKINRAYEILSDPIQKREYDYKEKNPFFKKDNIFNNNPEMNNGIPDFFKMFFGGMPNGIDEEMFNNMGQNTTFFRGAPNVRIFKNGRDIFKNRGKPVDITKTVRIDLKTAYMGINYPVEIERYIISDHQKMLEKETIYIDIPAGIDTNEIIKIEGKGNVGNQGIRGDVKLYIIVEDVDNIENSKINLIYKKTISLKQALTGFTFELEHLNGKSYKINNTTIIKHEYQSVVKNMGMIRGDKRGNMIITFDIEFPKNLSVEQKEALKKIL